MKTPQPSTSGAAQLTEPKLMPGKAWYRGKPLRKVQAAVNAILHHHPHRNLFIVALPKSGSTWLSNMLCAVPGYREWIPEYITVGDHTVRPESFQHLPVGYTVTKLHSPPTQAHVALFNSLQRPYVILYRDLRDVMVSAYFYLHNVSRGENAAPFQSLDLEEGMKRWMDERLQGRVAWIDGWLCGHDPKWGMVLRYEDLLRDTLGAFQGVCDHYEIDLSPARMRRIVERHAFQRATGRAPGTADAASFNRKGIAGDWVNYFTPEIKARFKAIAGEALVRLGYETSNDW